MSDYLTDLQQRTELGERKHQVKWLASANEQYEDMKAALLSVAESGEWGFTIGGPNLNNMVVAALAVRLREEEGLEAMRMGPGLWRVSWNR